MPERPCLELRGVRKQYGEQVAVDVRAWNLYAGQIVALLGPTGAGKSTLLRLLAAVEEPTAGTLSYGPQPTPLAALPLEQRRRLTMVFQRPQLMRGTVQQNIDWAVRLRGRQALAKSQTSDLLDRLNLSSFTHKPARTLSGGQAQLVAIARALILEPEVLLLDEPTSHLDPAHVALVEQAIQADFERRRPVVVWATHNFFQARRVAHRVALLLGGQFVELAETEAFFREPADPRTKSFVEGRMIY